MKQLDPCYGLSTLWPLDPDLVPTIYGGDSMYKKSALGNAALATSAQTLTKTLALYPAWGWEGSRCQGDCWRDGSMPGTFTWAAQRNDGVDVAMVFNTRAFNTSTVEDGNFAQVTYYYLNTFQEKSL